ncbi:hypothetical protein GOD80_25860 [Sinorhizobium medicae]|nr:hypothetical protein [Sinorhizobium medicae]MDX0590152.1 hypothetical protein [Sinorhizobium medicae]MDX0808588.1 hypothetical protein [Sinorhizobium medicae]MDX2385079.1 hypothetical protein [Sinorhizobium medicae]
MGTRHVKNFIIAMLVVLLVWLAAALVRVENERYALLLQMCPRQNCDGVETRTSWIWHLIYGLGIM